VFSMKCQRPATWTEWCQDGGASPHEIDLEGLTDRSRRPYRHANQLLFQIVRPMIRLKQDKPSWVWRYGQEAEVMFASHSWPRFGNARVQEVMRGQRDAYAHLNNYVLFLANQGVTINKVHNVYQLPKSLQNKWYARSYDGSEFHNSRAVINRYIGYWDCNPATLTPLSPSDSAPFTSR
jgi:Alkyl sulfatase dimerisation